MRIKFKKHAGSTPISCSIADVVIDIATSDNDGSVERVRALAKASIEFTESLIDILHEKGILNDADISRIVENTIGFHVHDDVVEIINEETH